MTPPPPLSWLLGDEAAAVLAEIAAAQVTPALLTSLRKQLGDPRHAAAVVELAELRRRGTNKFANAAEMFFTRRGLEQATDEWIARYKARRLDGFTTVVDACCGVGGDLVGSAQGVADRIGIDADAAMTAFAQRNAAAYDVNATVTTTMLDAENLPECDAWHADPDRRPAGRRTTQPDAHEPSLATLAAWRRRTPAAAIKLAPAAQLPGDWQAECELEWISRGGECRQLVAWAGPLARKPGKRRATKLSGDGALATFLGAADERAEIATSIGDWLHDFDPAVLAADLEGSLANQNQLQQVTPRVAYFTSDTPAADPLVASFRVVEAMPLSRKRLAGWLAERGVGTLEIKCRGVDVRPESLRRELKPRGDAAMTLLVFPDQHGKPTVVAANRP
ncbi:RNA cap guanine-N2 methyltransferase [Botrimarina colliarenosi]|uniref:RNA cap guanine-N2 methyltransferase n=1 Tax=Botrimarina colliarenosi TaxID=2528001 RepID=A0A5C6AK32_9BACT|nr:class I SAM-dependent methyltransferase [Botrimarina colliarenosi]TWT99525.1 RNA cap guanine-N2 methyltransferase [Botrimarina colliarenosi]